MPESFCFSRSWLCTLPDIFRQKMFKKQDGMPEFFDTVPIVAHIFGAVFDPQTLILGAWGSFGHPWAPFWWPWAPQGFPR